MDMGAVVGGAIGSGGTVLVWIGRQFVLSVAGGRRERNHNGVTVDQLDAALSRFEVRLLDRFNGRYPSKEIFTRGMEEMQRDHKEIRSYIKDVEERLCLKIDQGLERLEGRTGSGA